MRKWIMPNIFGLALFVIFLIIFKNREIGAKSNIFIESFSLSGLFILFGTGIVYVEREGVFNIAVYGIKKFFTIFKKPNPENKLPSTYIEYNEIRNSREKLALWPALLIGIIYISIGMLLYFFIKK